MKDSTKFWDKRAKQFSQQSSKDDPVFSKTLENVKSYMNSNDIVLDFACGTANLSLQIANRAQKILAIDTSKGMLSLAKTKAAESNIQNIEFAQIDIFDKSCKENSFDLVLAFNILHLLEDKKVAIGRIGQLLKSGGIFISSTACLGEGKTLFGSIISLLSRLNLVPSIKVFNLASLNEDIVGSGFEVLEVNKPYLKQPNYYIVAKKLVLKP